MNIARLALLALPLFIAACATNPPDGKEDVAVAKMECDKTYRVGSMMPKKDCAPAVSDDERRLMQQELSRIRPAAGQPPGK